MEVKKPACAGFFIQLNCKKSDEITYDHQQQEQQLVQLQQLEPRLEQQLEQLQQLELELELELEQLQQLELELELELELQLAYRHKRSKQETTEQLQEQSFSFYFLGS